MRKTKTNQANRTKLVLATETIRALRLEQLAEVRGGQGHTSFSCGDICTVG